MVLTPTYHVFRMFSVHHDAKLLNTDLRCEDYAYNNKRISSISASASMDKEGKVHVSLANLNPNKAVTVTCPIVGEAYKNLTGEVLTAPEMNSFNTFENPDAVKPASFKDFSYKNGMLTINMPSKSVVVIEMTK
jgi:alpha-N-arabinofuranosidase